MAQQVISGIVDFGTVFLIVTMTCSPSAVFLLVTTEHEVKPIVSKLTMDNVSNRFFISFSSLFLKHSGIILPKMVFTFKHKGEKCIIFNIINRRFFQESGRGSDFWNFQRTFAFLTHKIN